MNLQRANYPRPMMLRNEWISLDGQWDFAFIHEQEFLDGKLNRNNNHEIRGIMVPYSYHSPYSNIGDSSYHPHLWYHKKMQVPHHTRQVLYLHFEAIDYMAKVYVNSQYVGTHEGGYNRFSFDITRYLKGDCLEIEVYVEDTLSKEQPRGKQRYRKENFECWYIETSGIWKTAWIEVVNETHLSNLDYHYSNAKLSLDLLTLSAHKDDVLKVTLLDTFRNAVSRYSGPIVSSLELSLPIDLFLWSDESPYLYDIEIEILRNDRVLDFVSSYVGFRFLTWDQQYRNNNQKLDLRMILDQGYFEDKHLTCKIEDLLKDLTLIKSIGLNGIRKHEKLEDQRFNYLCDVMGIYTWQEMPSFYEFTTRSATRLKQEWIEAIHQYKLHPSIIAWVPFNESWGIFDVMNNSDQQAYADQIVVITKHLDATRPVVSNDGWEHTTSDLITLHNYAEYGDSLLQTYQDISLVLANKEVHPKPPRLAFANGYHYQSQPLLLTEFAGIAFEGIDGWGYGHSVKSQAEFITRLESLIDAIRKMPFFQGYCITQLTDVQQEKNGLFFENRTPKIPLEELKKLIK
jgi:beta-galactosidase/beta-glucuronidase